MGQSEKLLNPAAVGDSGAPVWLPNGPHDACSDSLLQAYYPWHGFPSQHRKFYCCCHCIQMSQSWGPVLVVMLFPTSSASGTPLLEGICQDYFIHMQVVT